MTDSKRLLVPVRSTLQATISVAVLALLVTSCRSTESSLSGPDAGYRGRSTVHSAGQPSGAVSDSATRPGKFDPCQEFEYRAESSHLAWEAAYRAGKQAAMAQAERLQGEAKIVLDASNALHDRRLEKALALQDEERSCAARLAERADGFRSEVLLLSGLREHGSDHAPTAAEAPNWERFVVLEDPPANLWYKLDPENRLAGERRRLTLQETMFTEFPKYQERSALARDELYIAQEKTAAALEVKEESRVAVVSARKQWEAKRANLEAARAEFREADRARTLFIEAQAALQECRDEESPARHWLNASAELAGIRSLTASLNEALDRGQDEIERLARPGYRAAAEEALASARQKMGQVLRYEKEAREALEEAAENLTAIAPSAEAHALATRATQLALDAARRLRLTADEIPARVDSSLDLACVAEERFFADSGFERKRREIVEQRLYDARDLQRLRAMSPFESLNRHWDEMRLFERLPEKLELYARGEYVDLIPELVEAATSMVRTFQQSFHPCEPHLGGNQALERFQGEDGGAASRAELLRRAGDLCDLLGRIQNLMESAPR